MKRVSLLAAMAVIAATSFGAAPSFAANTLGKRYAGSAASRALTTPRSLGGLPTMPSGTPCRETYQPGPNGTLGGYTNPCTGAYRPAVN